MGNFLSNCQKPAQRTVGESDLPDVEVQQGEFPRKNFDIYDNPEDIIIEITTHTKWEYHEGRQLLSKYRQICGNETVISRSLFNEDLLPNLLRSLMKDVDAFREQHADVFLKLSTSMWKLFREDCQTKDGIDFVGFVKVLGNACKGSDEERAMVVFHVFDVDLDTYWNEREIELFLSQCNSEFLKLDSISNWDKEATAPPPDSASGDELDSGNDENDADVNADDGKERERDDDDDAPSTEELNSGLGDDGDDDERQPLTENETLGVEASPIPDVEPATPSVPDTESVGGTPAPPDYPTEDGEDVSGGDGERAASSGDFEPVGSMSDQPIEVDDPWALVGEHLRKRTNNRTNRLSEKKAVAYLGRALDLPRLLASFYILPSKREEREAIRSMMDAAGMSLGSTWFVISAEWWNAWAKYVEYEVDRNAKRLSTVAAATDSIDLFASHSSARSMRPLGVSNADLLDGNLHDPILKDDLAENDDYLLVPRDVWDQFLGWYGGGPPIPREVICVQKEVRDRIWDLKLPAVRIEHELKEQVAQSKGKHVAVTDDGGEADEKMNDLMAELNVMTNPQALRIDLRPVYAVCYSFGAKGRVNQHDMKPINITRYATLLEFYEYACAVLGIDPSDYDVNVRPRLWQLVNAHGELKQRSLLYPHQKSTTKICLAIDRLDDKKRKVRTLYPAFIEEEVVAESRPTETSDVVVTAVDDGDDDGAVTDDVNATEDDDSREVVNEEDLDDLASLGIASGISVGVEVVNDKGDYTLANPNDDSWKQFRSGCQIDCRDSLGKWYEATIEKVKLIDLDAPDPEGAVTETASMDAIDEGSAVAAGTGSEETASAGAQTASTSPSGASVKGTPPTSGTKRKGPPNGRIDEPPVLRAAAIFVHYKSWPRKWDEWIPLRRGMVCHCARVCELKEEHRIAKPQTQSVWKGGRTGGTYSSGGSRYGYSSYARGPRASMSGAPTIPGVVGLSNLGNTCFMNSILQCLSNTPHLQSFFLTGQFKQDINKSNVLGTGGRLANEFHGLLNEMWSGKYKVVAPRSMKRSIGHFAPQFEGYQQHDSQEFLSFLLDGLHEDLNLVKEKPYTEKIESDGRPDSVVSKLAWQIHLLRNQSKIVDLFQCQVKSKVFCPECNRVSTTFDPLMYLSLPIPGQMKKDLVVDVLIQGRSLPIRHVFKANKYDRARVIASEISEIYGWREDFILLYEIWNNKIQRELDKNTWISSIHTHARGDKVVAYLLKDWNAIIPPETIKKEKIRLMLGYFNQSLGHSDTAKELSGTSKVGTGSASGGSKRITTRGFSQRSYTSYRETFYFGLPLVVSYLNTNTRKELHHLVRDRLKNIVPHLFETQPQPESENPAEATDEATTEPAAEPPAEAEAEAETDPELETAPTATTTAAEDDAAPPSYDSVAEPENFEEALPYRLICFDDYRKRTAYNKGTVHSSMIVSYDDELFVDTVSLSRGVNQELTFVIEWKEHVLRDVHKSLSSVLKSESYETFKSAGSGANANSNNLSIFDCINNYCHEEILSKGEEWYCSVCGKFQQATKKLDLWSFPEILIIHLKRFQMLSGRRGEKINLTIDYELRGLDLSRYVIDDELATKPVYDLFAVSCHNGGLGGGHYTAYAKHPHEHRWFSFNDSNVRPAQESEVLTNSAYVLFYRKCH